MKKKGTSAPRRMIPTIGSDHGSIGISINRRIPGCDPTPGSLVLGLIGSYDRNPIEFHRIV